MTTLQSTGVDVRDIVSLVARKNGVSPSKIFPFADFTAFLSGLLKELAKPGSHLLGGGHVEPEVETAADRAGVELTECIGQSPFSGSLKALLDNVGSRKDIIYVANPNRVTGANYSLADLKRMAEAVPEGAVLIDEYYHDHFGISGQPLLEEYPQVILLRSFAAAYGIRSSDSGYAIGSKGMIERMDKPGSTGEFTATIRKVITTTLMNEEISSLRLREIHEESLRLATGLTRLGVQCRITATDFVLLRVADPAKVGNLLTRDKISVDNLDGYPEMKHYLRYRIQSPLSNDKFLKSFELMPADAYRMKTIDHRAITMRLQAHGEPSGERREERPVRVAERHIFGLADLDEVETVKRHKVSE